MGTSRMLCGTTPPFEIGRCYRVPSSGPGTAHGAEPLEVGVVDPAQLEPRVEEELELDRQARHPAAFERAGGEELGVALLEGRRRARPLVVVV